MQSLRWPNTVRLTLSIQRSSELTLLFQPDALPMIEHLNITNEELPAAPSQDQNQFLPNSQPFKQDSHQMTDNCRLRSLLIRYIWLGDLLELISSLKMPLLEQLTLIDLYDNSKLSLFGMKLEVEGFHQLSHVICLNPTISLAFIRMNDEIKLRYETIEKQITCFGESHL